MYTEYKSLYMIITKLHTSLNLNKRKIKIIKIQFPSTDFDYQNSEYKILIQISLTKSESPCIRNTHTSILYHCQTRATA